MRLCRWSPWWRCRHGKPKITISLFTRVTNLLPSISLPFTTHTALSISTFPEDTAVKISVQCAVSFARVTTVTRVRGEQTGKLSQPGVSCHW